MTIQATKIVTVFGGTGKLPLPGNNCRTLISPGSQGSSAARSLLAHKDRLFQVRVITRDLKSDKAQNLAALGAELVQADGFNHNQMMAAFQGSWGAFVNTNSDDEVGRAVPSPYGEVNSCLLTRYQN